MRAFIALPLLSLLLPGCIPLYIAGARVAVSTIAGVASGVAAGGAPGEVEKPQEITALLETYKRCLAQRATTPGLDCGWYRAAMLEATPR
jgi:hypothetical protein